MNTTIDQKTLTYFRNVIEFHYLINGVDGIQMLLKDKSSLKKAMIEYNAAYESFLNKFLGLPKEGKDVILYKIASDIYLTLKTRKANQTLNQMLESL